MRACTQALPAPVAIMTVATALGNVDSPTDIRIIDLATALVLDAEILADFVDLDSARAVVADNHSPAHIRGIDTAGSIALDDERAGDIANIDVARAVIDSNIAANVF